MERHFMLRLVATTLVLAGLIGAPSTASAEVRYTVTDLGAVCQEALGDLGTLVPERIRGLNDQGQIIGGYVEVWEDGGEFSITHESDHAFVWDPINGLQDLGRDTTAFAINDLGQVAGQQTRAAPVLEGFFVWDRNNGTQFMHLYTQFGDGWNTRLSDINNQGQVVGTDSDGIPDNHAFAWNPTDGVTHLFPAEQDFSFAGAINDVGQIVGEYAYSEESQHAFLWDPVDGLLDLGPTSDFSASDINDLGQIVGTGPCAAPTLEDPDQVVQGLHLWQDGEFQELGTFSGKPTFVKSINNLGQIIGDTFLVTNGVASREAWLWEPGEGIQDLNALIPPDSPWHITDVADINDEGWILCYQVDDALQVTTLLLKPVPEPGTTAMLLAIVAVVGTLRLRPRQPAAS